MPRYRALVAYDGSAFHGWQTQPTVRTVEGELSKALTKIAGRNKRVRGASRTDAGVHSEGQVAHFDYDGCMDAWRLREGLNALCGHDMRVMVLEEVDPDFHARHDAWGKLYRYDLWNDRIEHPLYRRWATHMKGPLDLDAMRRAARHLEGEHDFTSFRGAGCSALSPTVFLEKVAIRATGPLVRVYVEGSAFLKYMVRNLTGALIDVGQGRQDVDSIPDLLESRDRTKVGKTAPAKGLRLIYVRYPHHPWDDGERCKSVTLARD